MRWQVASRELSVIATELHEAVLISTICCEEATEVQLETLWRILRLATFCGREPPNLGESTGQDSP